MSRKMSAEKVAAWKKAHPTLLIEEDVLATAGPWPSLQISDFLVYARNSDHYPKEVIKFMEEAAQELTFAYEGWARAVHQSDTRWLMADLFQNTAGSDAYAFTRKFLQDYARDRGLLLDVKQEEEDLPPWLQGGETTGGVTSAQPIVEQPPMETVPPLDFKSLQAISEDHLKRKGRRRA